MKEIIYIKSLNAQLYELNNFFNSFFNVVTNLVFIFQCVIYCQNSVNIYNSDISYINWKILNQRKKYLNSIQINWRIVEKLKWIAYNLTFFKLFWVIVDNCRFYCYITTKQTVLSMFSEKVPSNSHIMKNYQLLAIDYQNYL